MHQRNMQSISFSAIDVPSLIIHKDCQKVSTYSTHRCIANYMGMHQENTRQFKTTIHKQALLPDQFPIAALALEGWTSHWKTGLSETMSQTQ